METKSFDLKKFLMKYVMYLFLILMCIVLTIASDKFLTLTNLMTIIKQISIQSIVAIGMTMIIISGNIDLSVGSLVALCSVSCAMLMNKGLPTIIAVLAAVIIGAFAGFITGGVTAKLKLHSFLVTLALMTALRGLAQTLTNGRPVAGLPSSFGKVASGTVGPVPLLVIYMIVLYPKFPFPVQFHISVSALPEVLPSDKLPLPFLCSCPQLLLYCFALIHSSLPSSIPVLSEYGHLFQKLYIVFRMFFISNYQICTGSSLRNNNGSNDICPDPCPAKAGQDHPGKTYQCWINVEIFCNTAAYTAQHIIYR